VNGLRRTFQLRLPQGPHEAVLAQMAEHLGLVERRLHLALTQAFREAEAEIEATGGAAVVDQLLESRRDETGKKPPGPLQLRKNAIKTAFIAGHGISARQFNSLLTLLEGRYASVQEAGEARLDLLQAKLGKLEKKISTRGKKMASFAKISREVDARAKVGKGPTNAQAKKLLTRRDYERACFYQHQQKRRAMAVSRQIDSLKADLARPVPALVFGSRALLRERSKIGPRDLQGQAAWRRRWEAARASGFLALGSKDETAGCQSCIGDIVAEHRISLRLRLPDAICGTGERHLHLRDLELPMFGRAEIVAALMAHRTDGSERRALSYRFIRDGDWNDGNNLSAWRICITLDQVVPEITDRGFDRREDRRGQPTTAATGPSASFLGAIGVDVNGDHLAWAMIDRHGNPVSGRSGRIELPLRGKSSGWRATLIGNAARDLVKIAMELKLPLVLEQLDFRAKKRELTEEGAHYARMLSSFAYAAIQTAIRRRALRLGVELVDVNPAWTSLIGRTNLATRYGISVHVAAAVAIARRAARFSERINYIHGPRGRRNTLPTQSESRRHVWRQWALVLKDEKARKRASGIRPVAGAAKSSPPSTPQGAKGDAVMPHPARGMARER
jgi:IS605 OrfB family transposase